MAVEKVKPKRTPLSPIIFKKYDPENGHLSKEEYLAKQRKQKELAAKMAAYEEKARAEVEAEDKETKKLPKTEQKKS